MPKRQKRITLVSYKTGRKTSISPRNLRSIGEGIRRIRTADRRRNQGR